MTRYSAALTEFVDRLRSERRGWFLVRCAPGDQDEIADEIAHRLGFPRAPLTDDVEPFTSCVISAPTGLDAAVRDASLRALNARRDRLSERGIWVLVVTRADLLPLQRQAMDIFSVLRGIAELPLIPRHLDAAAEADALVQLGKHYRDRFGRLDLRGFVRAENEDASFPIEDIFEPLEAEQSSIAFDRIMNANAPMPVSGSLPALIQATRGPVVLVGGPGAGKSFFLRWWLLQATSGTGRSSDGIEPAVAVLVSLAAVRLAPGPIGLDEYASEALLAEGLAAGHLLDRAAREGRAVFLLDGLDEAGDLAGRALALDAIAALAKKYPQARIVVTTRPSGRDDLEDDERLAATIYSIAPLSARGIAALLTRWCELYERHREGTEAAAARGRATGEALARDVLASPSVRALATSPLLATVIAIVHRAGVRLPDRRVELYDHILRILVERWNQVRTRDVAGAIPLRLPDAIRLLGPVALEMIEHDREGAIEEATLHDMLARALAAGNVRGLESAAVAIDLFRRSLGLLVERAPGVYGFLHQTLVEFLAAHELIRTGRFVTLAKNARTAFKSEWREVILLGAGILGVLQADDERLSATVRALVMAAQGKQGRPSVGVPRLLADLLADDPALMHRDALVLIDELVPKWWFDRRYTETQTYAVLDDASFGLASQLDSRWREALAARLQQRYARGVVRVPLVETSAAGWPLLRYALERFGIEIAPLVCQVYCLQGPRRGLIWSTLMEPGPGAGLQRVRLSRGMQVLWKHTAESGTWHLSALDPTHQLSSPALVDGWLTVEIDAMLSGDHPTVWLRFAVPRDAEAGPAALAAVKSAWRELAVMFPDYVQPDD